MFAGSSFAQRSAPPPPDPFLLNDASFAGNPPNLATTGLTPRSQVINPAQKTLVLIEDGQSQGNNVAPTVYIPTNSAAIDNFNIYDGASYPIVGPIIGVQNTTPPGNISPKIADKLVTAAIFDRVILVPMCVGGTLIADHATGSLSGRIGVVMARLASRGITPSTPGVTFAYLWLQGESDQGAGTTQANYAAALTQIKANLTAAGFVGRMFVAEETWSVGAISTAIQAAQIAFVNGTTVFSAGNMDALNATNRDASNLHLNDAGQAAFATTIVNNMIASGAPF